MNELHYLKDIVIILGFGVVVVSLLRKLKLPTIAGFILVGILVGPKGLKFINDTHQIEVLSEIGVTLLLFGIGLEFPLERFKRLWKPVIAGGTAQVGLSVIIAYFIARAFGISSPVALFTGFVVAISSTAIVLQGLEQRGEIDAPHGRFTLGILIFQDLCVVPMVLAVPLMAGTGNGSHGITATIIRSLAVIVVVLSASRLIVPRIMNMIAGTRNRYLFIMATLAICVGTAWITASFGVSLALGAFLGGLVVAGSEYRHQALADIIPFREIFVSIFFVSVGMLLDPAAVIDNYILLIVLLIGIMAGKFIVVFGTGLILRMPPRVSALSATALSQVGEFSFVLVGVAVSYELVDSTYAGSLVAVTVLSMLATPFALNLAPKLAAGLGTSRMLVRFLGVPTAEDMADKSKPTLENHIIIGGYGVAGRELALALKESGIPYIIAELNPNNVHDARQAERHVCYGDITSAEVLNRMGAMRAREFVIVINDPTATERAVKAARDAAPKLHITVRTRYLDDIKSLKKAGADEVIVSEVEASSELVSRILHRHNAADDIIRKYTERIRNRANTDTE